MRALKNFGSLCLFSITEINKYHILQQDILMRELATFMILCKHHLSLADYYMCVHTFIIHIQTTDTKLL